MRKKILIVNLIHLSSPVESLHTEATFFFDPFSCTFKMSPKLTTGTRLKSNNERKLTEKKSEKYPQGAMRNNNSETGKDATKETKPKCYQEN